MNSVLMREFCLSFLGIPYIWGGDDPMTGFDCSGFAQEFLAAFGAHPKPGIDLTAQGLYQELTKTGRYGARDLGSLAFFGKSSQKVTHVAVLLSPQLMFEFGGGGSRTVTLNEAKKQNAYGRIRPLDSRPDLVACVLPKFPYP